METLPHYSSNLNMPFDLTVAKSWSRTSKPKHVSVSSNRRNTPYTCTNPNKCKTKMHSRQCSLLRKSKSKCETEVNYSTKKKSGENESIGKKTLKKVKKVEATMRYSQNKLTNPKKDSELSSVKSRKKWNRKELFHSTCFSRLIEP